MTRLKLVRVVVCIMCIRLCAGQNDDLDSRKLSMVNMCGIVGQNRPTKPGDCIEGELDFGGNCCFVKFTPKDSNVQGFTACITVKMFNEETLATSHKVAEGMNYKLDIICSENSIKWKYWSVVVFVCVLL